MKIMKCDAAMNEVYEGNGLPFRERLTLALHILFCGRCAVEARRLEETYRIMATGFFPFSPDFEDAIMAKIGKETLPEAVFEEDDVPGGVPTKGWVIAGCAILVSLATSFFGKDFIAIASLHGSKFLLPLGIIIGIFITGYGALFIGSHLKELSGRFHLR